MSNTDRRQIKVDQLCISCIRSKLELDCVPYTHELWDRDTTVRWFGLNPS